MASLQTLLPVALWLSLAAVSSAKCAFTQPCYTGKLDDPTCVPVATNSSNDQPKPVRYPFLPPTADHLLPPRLLSLCLPTVCTAAWSSSHALPSI